MPSEPDKQLGWKAMIIRALKPEDLRRVGELAGQLVRQHHETDPERFFSIPNVERGYAEYFRSQLKDKNAVLLVAEEGDAILGYSYGRLEPRDWNMLLDEHGAIHDILVDPAARRSGTGRSLVTAMMSELAKRGAKRVVLATMVGNTAAQKLFESVGFRPTMLEMTAPSPQVAGERPSKGRSRR
jgi:ribosomal protein S18 acetylase RimI-like enzyme